MNQYKVTVTFEMVVGHNDPASAIDDACVHIREEFGGSPEGVLITEVHAHLLKEGVKQ